MLKNYLVVAFRNLFRQKGYSAINITGLAVGLAASFFILLWVQDELRHDRFLEEGERIHVVWRNVNIGDDVFTWNATSKPLAAVLETDYPEIEQAVNTYWTQDFVVTAEGRSFRESGNYADADFFDVFAFPFIAGTPRTALQGESSVVITDRTARKIFGEDWRRTGRVLGQTLTIDQRKDFVITGIIEDIPPISTLQFDVLLPIADFYARNTWADNWGSNGFPLYVKLREGASPASVNEKIGDVVNRNEEGADETIFLQPYEDVYLHSDYRQGRLVGGRIEYVRIFSVVAIFLLVIASINFMNLATARSARRSREVGVRKAIGAGRKSLIMQFLGESALLSFIAFGFAVTLVLILLPSFNALTGKHIGPSDLGVRFFLLGLAVAFVVGLLAGSYPALYLSSFRPIVVLRGAFSHLRGAASMRKGLVVFQFALSILLIVATIAVYLQVQYIRNSHLGLDRRNVISFAQEGAFRSQYEAVKQELLKRPGIESVTASSTNPLNIGSSTSGVTWEGKDPDAEHEVYVISAEYDFVQTMGMEIVAGRNYSRAFGADSAGYLINEELARIMGGDVLGKQVQLYGNSGPVIGVVENFNMQSLYAPIEPVIIWMLPAFTNMVFVRTRHGQTDEALAGIEAVFRQFNPEYPFDYRFLDQEFEAAYRSEAVLGKLSSLFALIAIFISCLGLLGLISYSAEQRTKEIGVRKVMGASVPHLVRLLTSEVTILVLVATVIAAPISYYAIRAWLSKFQFHVEIGYGMFLWAALLAVVIAWLTVSYQAIRAAMADPVRSLRYE